ncbi:hypothetical protein AAFC00_004536 [Neodothiora populina]|uniref:PWI domain-containing protein n=1 Tax=Neodothiora populina TaxID=2781224 RepID=A0ABR3P2B4_9PEZI
MSYYPPPNFNRGGSYGSFPGAPAAPGMGPPPGMAPAPGMSPVNAQTPNLPGRPGSIPASFQPPPNMPANINFNAPVIRLGASAAPAASPGGENMSGNRNRMGLGADSRSGGNDYNRQRDAERTFVPPTMEEVRRTIFVAGLDEGVPSDAQLEEILSCGGAVRLRRWARLTDADNKLCKFGFAEYEDANSLHVVSEIFKDSAVQVPLRDQNGSGALIKDDDDEVKKAKLMVIIDEKSAEYIEQWSRSKISDQDLQFKLDTARDDLAACLKRLASRDTLNATTGTDANGDSAMADDSDILNISVPAAAATSQEDELSDIPAEMRETVAAEIKAFRDRSLQRDLERLKKEEELEAAERARSGPRPSRLASPPPSSAPSGPNGAPLGPRGNVVAGAPQGPKGYRGAQMPKDYADGVDFTNGANDQDDQDDDASDEEIERRKQEKRAEELEKVYLDQERRWLNVERRHIASLARAEAEEQSEEASKAKRREALAEKFRSFDDEEELRRPSELFYRDRKAWRRARADFRRMERERDDMDRRDEDRELNREKRRLDAARGMADDFLSQTGEEISASRSKPQPKANFSLNLGGFSMGGASAGAATYEEEEDRKQERSAGRSHRMQDMENLLDDEEENGAAGTGERKALRTVEFKPLAPGEKMSDEQRVAASKELAARIPTSTQALFAWPVKWDHLTPAIIEEQLRPYVQKKIFQSLGVQEDMLVDIIESVVRERGSPEKIVEELSGLLDEEAEDLARKVWRMVVFYSEVEAQGLGDGA